MSNLRKNQFNPVKVDLRGGGISGRSGPGGRYFPGTGGPVKSMVKHFLLQIIDVESDAFQISMSILESSHCPVMGKPGEIMTAIIIK